MLTTLTLDLPDLAATETLGRRLGAQLFPGAVIALVGPLGAGKTHLTRAICEGLEVANPRVVVSPTFGLIHEYTGRLPINHFDAYRLPNAEAFAELGVHEYFEGLGVSLVEWADRVEACLPVEHLRVTLTVTGESSRQVIFQARGERYARFLPLLVGEATMPEKRES